MAQKVAPGHKHHQLGAGGGGGRKADRFSVKYTLLHVFGGVFAQRGHSANYYDDYPGNNPENHLRNHAQSIQNSKIQTSDVCHGSQGPKFCPL